MAQRKVKARYHVQGPIKVTVRTRQSRMEKVEGSDMPAKVDKFVDEEKEMFFIRLPQGHSVRVDKKELIRLGMHVKPKLVDMETGEIVDFGGDPYDFIGDVQTIPMEDDPNYHYTITELLEDEDSGLEDTETKASKKG